MESKNDNSPAILNGNVARIKKGLTEMMTLDIEDFKINYGIARTLANLDVAEKAYNKSLSVFQKKYVKKDENGSLMVQNIGVNTFFIFNNGADKNSYMADLEKLNETIVDVKVWKMKASDLEKIKGLKSTTMSSYMELIIDDLEEKNNDLEEKK